MGPYKTSIECNVRGPDGKPIVGPDGHIHLPDHLQEPAAAPAPTEEAPTAVAIDQPAPGAPGAGDVALEPVPPAAGDGAPAPPADGGAPLAEPGKDAPAGGGGEVPPAPPAPPAPEQPPAVNSGGGGGGFLRNVFGWGN